MRWTVLVLMLVALTGYSYFSSNSNDMEELSVQPGDDMLAKDDPVFMESMESLKETAPAAHKLIMKKVESGATVAEIKRYIYTPD